MRLWAGTRSAVVLAVAVAAAVAVGGLSAGCRDGDRLANASAAFDVAPGTLDFGPTALGDRRRITVRVANRGLAPLRVTKATSSLPLVDFPGFDAFELASGETRDVEVTFAPQVEGQVSGVLGLETDTASVRAQVPVSGQGVESLAEVRTAAVDFGVVPLNTVKMGELVVANPRAVMVRVQVDFAGADADEFTAGASGRALDLAPGEVRSIPVAFQPTRLGVAQATAAVFACPACPAVHVPLSGTGLASMLDISPMVVDFGRVPVGATAGADVTVRNLGTSAFDFTGAALLNDASGAFALTSVPSPPGGRLEPGMSVVVSLSFTPKVTGAVPGVLLQIRASPAGSGAPGPKLSVLGAGGTPCLSVSPAALDFGPVPEGMTGTLSLLLGNRCQEQIQISGQAITTQQGGYFSLPAGSSPIFIPGGNSARMSVAYTPRPGSTTSLGLLGLRVYQQGGSSGSEQVQLRGAAISLPPCAYQLAPAALDFGAVPVGAAVTLGLSVRNTGASDCFLSALQVASGSDPQLTADPLSSRLIPPGGAATLRVRFQPTANGPFAGLAEGWVNHPTAGHPTAPLSGSGTSSCFSLSPATVDFGLVGLGCPARLRAVMGHNRCTEPVVVESAALEGLPGGPFSLLSGPAAGTSIPASGSATWSLRYAPSAEADDLAALRVGALGATFTAGLLGTAKGNPTRTDHFLQQGQAKVDVLLVIDNSGSLMEEQAGLAQNFAAFLSGAQAQNANYHIAVTTTGIEPSLYGWSACPGGVQGGEAGRLFPADNSSPRVITPQTPDAGQVFAANVTVGTCHWDERGLEAAYRALSAPLVDSADAPGTPLPNDGNLGFLRQDAKLAVVFVSDEEDASPQPVAYYETFLRALKGNDPSRLVVSAIVGPQDLTTCPTAASSGVRYIQLAHATGGLVESICTQSWAQSLANISVGVFSPRRIFPLSQVPEEPQEISVLVDGQPVTSGWTYDAGTNSVVFAEGAAPPAGATVDIVYPLGC